MRLPAGRREIRRRPSRARAFPVAVMLYTRVVGSRTVQRPDGLTREIEGCWMDKGRVVDASA